MGNVKELKQQNIMEAIRILQNEKELSKPELSKRMGISTVSAHSFINELVERQIVLSSGASSSNHGRKASLFRLNPNYGFAVGMVLSSNSIQTVAYDFTSKLISGFSLNLDKTADEDICSKMIAQARIAIANHKSDYGKCFGIGIAIPGIVDHNTDLIKNSVHFPNFKPLDLKFIIQDTLQVPVFIGNDNKLCMNAIKWSENRSLLSPVVFIGVEEGVGCGIMINGQILQGANSVAGEIGHIPINLDGPLCNCGNSGCLEHYIAQRGLIDRVIKHLNENSDSDSEYNSENFTIEHVISLARHNDFVHNALMDCCRYFCILLENVIKIYGPKEIIIECEYLKRLPEYFQYLVEQFHKSPWVQGQDYVLRLNTIDHVYAAGGAMTVLDHTYTSNTNNALLDFLDEVTA